jgi:rhodanese-related sulfurtransferase
VKNTDTTVVVHCAGITRAALGAQGILNCGIKNPVYSLINGTRGWDMIDGELLIDQPIEEARPSRAAKVFSSEAATRLARERKLKYINPDDLETWQKANLTRTVYKIDIRSEQEYLEEHFPGTIWIPGGELVGMTIDHLATQNARLCLYADSDCARAEITAGWMNQQDWSDVVIANDWKKVTSLQSGSEPDYFPELEHIDIDRVTPQLCQKILNSTDTLLLDFSTSASHRKSHIPAVVWASRAQLYRQYKNLSDSADIICSSEDGVIALLAARDLEKLTGRPVKVLQGGNSAWILAGFKTEPDIDEILGEIDDIDKLSPTGTDRDSIMRWHQQGISWREGLYKKFKQDKPVKFHANDS